MTDTETLTITKPPKVKGAKFGKRLNPAEMAESIALWRTGMHTLDELAARFGRDRTVFLRLFKAQGIAKGASSVEVTRKITAAVESASMLEIELITKRIKDTKDEHYKICSGLTKLTWELIVKCREDKKSFTTILTDLKSLKYAADTFRITRAEKYVLLGLNEKEAVDDDEVGDLIVQEITQAEIQEMHKGQSSIEDLRLIDVEEIEDVPTPVLEQ